MTPHIEAQQGDYADIVLMPGDPIRALFIAERFLDDFRLVNRVRNCFGFTGTYKGKIVSIQASGMGQPSLGIYATELFKFYNVESIIRVGTCGSFHENVKCGEIVLPITSYAEGKPHASPICSTKLLFDVVSSLKDFDLTYHVGEFISNDNYYKEEMNWWQPLADKNIFGVDMETYMLYTIAKNFGKRALTVNLVSDNLVTGEDIGQDRVAGVEKMVESILEAIW